MPYTFGGGDAITERINAQIAALPPGQRAQVLAGGTKAARAVGIDIPNGYQLSLMGKKAEKSPTLMSSIAETASMAGPFAYGAAGGFGGATGAAGAMTPMEATDLPWTPPPAPSGAMPWLKPALAIGGPLAMRGLSGGGGGGDVGGPNGNGLDDARSAQLEQLTQLLIDKSKRTVPVHEAAMRMAGRMAPSGAPSPRMTQAISAAQTPRQTPSTDPRVLEAIQRLMSGAK